MVFKKKPRFRLIVRVSLVVLAFFGVPVWLFVVGLITDSVLVWGVLLFWLFVSYYICWRVENG